VPAHPEKSAASSVWTVAAGAVLLIWLAQVAFPAVCTLVHARRRGVRRTLDLPLVRLSFIIGTRVTLGLAAGVLPGLWLQARYAFAPLTTTSGLDGPASRILAAGTPETRSARSLLLLVSPAALLVSMLGQSAVAAIAEAIGHPRRIHVECGDTRRSCPLCQRAVRPCVWTGARGCVAERRAPLARPLDARDMSRPSGTTLSISVSSP
jgi:hypothetical protein